MRRSLFILLVLGLALLGSSPGFAQQDQDLGQVLIDFWASEQGREVAREYSNGEDAPEPWLNRDDPMGDNNGFSTGETSGLTDIPGNLDITNVSAEWWVPPSTFYSPAAAGGIFCDDPASPVSGEFGTSCGADGISADAFAEGATIFNLRLGGELGGMRRIGTTCEWVLWFNIPEAGETWVNRDAFPNDPAGGTNRAIGYRINDEGAAPFRLDIVDGFFAPMPTNTVVAIGGSQLELHISDMEIEGATQVNAYTFCTDGGYSAADSASDQTGLIDLDHEDMVFYTIIDAPIVTTTTSTSTSTSTTAPPATESAGPSVTTEVTTPDGGNLTDGPLRRWNPIYIVVGGLVLLVGGYWVYYRTRERESGGGAAPPVHSTPRDEPHGSCDWALYFNGKVLRPANGHECCVYNLSVQTVNTQFEMASKGRQDGKNPHGEDASPDERLRIFDYDLASAAPDMKGFAGTRTGPAGRQDWMHGLGDPVFEAGWKSSDAGAQHPQELPLEEPVDVGVSLRYALETTVLASLTSGCPEHDNSYTLDTSSGISMFATQECTNGEPGPECPVELTASGIVDASVKGDVAYPLVMKAGTYPDEVERKSPESLEGPVGGIDSHDHATRPRTVWEDTASDSGGNVFDKDMTSVTLLSKLHLDSGQIVPIETWDTTERVTTDIRADIDHTLSLRGRMTTDCTDGCGGHGRCDCAPEFSLRIAAGKGTIEVDGRSVDIERTVFTDDWVTS